MSNIVSLDGVALESVSPYVQVSDVIELQPKRTTTTRERLGVPGSIVSQDHLDAKQVRVQFAILTDDPQKRTAALSDIAAWAMQGQYLTISDRPGQRLRVVCTATPITMSKRKWTELCEMTFTAYGVPFWEDAEPVEVSYAIMTLASSSKSHYLSHGNVRAVPFACTVTPRSVDMTYVHLSANGAEMTFDGINVPAGNPLTISYPDGYLTATYTDADGNEVHCLANRTGDEYIPLYLNTSNEITIAITDADGNPISGTLKVLERGWYW